MYKYYATIDQDGNITDAYSNIFRTPKEDDTCIDEQPLDGHLTLCGEINPPLRTEHGVYCYRWTGNEVVRKSDAEIQAEIDALSIAPLAPSYEDQPADIRAQQLAIMEGLAETYEMLLGEMPL